MTRRPVDPRAVTATVRAARAEADRQAYVQRPERADPSWDDAEAWGEP